MHIKPVPSKVVYSLIDYEVANCTCRSTQVSMEGSPFYHCEHICSLAKCLLALPIVFSVFHKLFVCIKLGYRFAFSLLRLTEARIHFT